MLILLFMLRKKTKRAWCLKCFTPIFEISCNYRVSLLICSTMFSLFLSNIFFLPQVRSRENYRSMRELFADVQQMSINAGLIQHAQARIQIATFATAGIHNQLVSLNRLRQNRAKKMATPFGYGLIDENALEFASQPHCKYCLHRL